MESLRVPQREVEVKVRLVDGRDLEGVMYVPPVGPHGGPGHLVDRLNAESGEFVPLTSGNKTSLVREDSILTVEIADDDSELTETEQDKKLLVKVFLANGENVIGRLSYLPEEDHERLQDYLNVGRRFIPLHVDDNLTFVNRAQVTSVLALRGED